MMPDAGVGKSCLEVNEQHQSVLRLLGYGMTEVPTLPTACDIEADVQETVTATLASMLEAGLQF